MKNKIFTGVFTAIVTPFDTNGDVDYDKLKKLIEFQIKNGISGIVPCGTTGESPCLNKEEKLKVIQTTVETVNKRVKVIAGTGGNCTSSSIEMSKEAEKLGVDGVMLVNPYYNKPTQEGLYLHFKTIADAISIPVMVYNIKGRTGVNVETPTLMRLINDCKNIKAVKEASANLDQMKDVVEQSPEDFCVLSGDDGFTYDLIKIGGDGIVSVASNAIPKEMVKMTTAALKEDFDTASKMNHELKPFFEAEFIETNPIPIKAVLAMQGKIKEIYRLPMCKMSDENKETLKQVMKDMEMI